MRRKNTSGRIPIQKRQVVEVKNDMWLGVSLSHKKLFCDSGVFVGSVWTCDPYGEVVLIHPCFGWFPGDYRPIPRIGNNRLLPLGEEFNGVNGLGAKASLPNHRAR
jgi:hypothetical protein